MLHINIKAVLLKIQGYFPQDSLLFQGYFSQMLSGYGDTPAELVFITPKGDPQLWLNKGTSFIVPRYNRHASVHRIILIRLLGGIENGKNILQI